MKTNPNAELDRMESLRKRFGFWVNAFRVRQVVSWLLKRIPWYSRSDCGSVRIRCWSDILAFNEIFRVGIYDPVFDAGAVAAYCDLGCQSGMALLRLAGRSGAPRHSMLVDGNPFAVERCRENVRLAAIHGVRILHGAVGCAERTGRSAVRFNWRPNELECGLESSQLAHAGAITMDVPVIDLEQAWVENFGDLPCDLLKMDIEGAELGVLNHDRAFLKRVRSFVLEWHDPPASRDAVIQCLQDLGFMDIRDVCRGEKSGVLYCHRSDGTGRA